MFNVLNIPDKPAHVTVHLFSIMWACLELSLLNSPGAYKDAPKRRQFSFQLFFRWLFTYYIAWVDRATVQMLKLSWYNKRWKKAIYVSGGR